MPQARPIHVFVVFSLFPDDPMGAGVRGVFFRFQDALREALELIPDDLTHEAWVRVETEGLWRPPRTLHELEQFFETQPDVLVVEPEGIPLGEGVERFRLNMDDENHSREDIQIVRQRVL